MLFCSRAWMTRLRGGTSCVSQTLPPISDPAPIVTRPGVRPGAEVLLSLEGWTRVQRGLAAIDAVEALGFAPQDIAPDYWRHIHNRLTAGLAPRAYGLTRHRAWRMRRELGA